MKHNSSLLTRSLYTIFAVVFLAPLILMLTPLPASAQVILAINASGPAVSNSGGGYASYVADEDFSGGTTSSFTATVSTTAVTNPAPEAVYQTQRYGNFTYTIPGLTAGANYEVRLHFSEGYWTASGDRLTGEPFRLAPGVHLCGVYQRHAQVEADLERRDLFVP